MTDQFGNAVAGATVTWSAAAGNLAAVTSVTDVNGMATDALTLSVTPGADPVTATVAGASGPISTNITETGN